MQAQRKRSVGRPGREAWLQTEEAEMYIGASAGAIVAIVLLVLLLIWVL
jgi:hypothetical protein